jgi:hypothetical protein
MRPHGPDREPHTHLVCIVFVARVLRVLLQIVAEVLAVRSLILVVVLIALPRVPP